MTRKQRLRYYDRTERFAYGLLGLLIGAVPASLICYVAYDSNGFTWWLLLGPLPGLILGLFGYFGKDKLTDFINELAESAGESERDSGKFRPFRRFRF